MISGASSSSSLENDDREVRDVEKFGKVTSLITEGHAIEHFSDDSEIDVKIGAGTDSNSGKKYKIVSSRDADVTLEFLEQWDSKVPPITEEQEKRLSRKVTWIVVSLTAFINLILYSDKATSSYASILGLFEEIGMTQNQYNNSNTLFYVGFIVGQVNLIFVQKYPLKYVVSSMTALWTVLVFLHCTASSYKGWYALRFFLGFVESIALPCLNTTMSQFLTADEKAATAPIFYSTCVGVTIPVGFIAYGVLNIKHSPVSLWKIFMIIIGGCTFLLTILILAVYPNNPTDAVFLNDEEKVWVIRRVQNTTNSSIEQKVIKKYQIKEALYDPISWLFGLFFLLQQLANNLTYQQNILFKSIGNISSLDSTLVSVAAGGFAMICCIIATTFLLYQKNFTGFSVVFWTIPSFVGSVAMVSLPFHAHIALLGMLCLASPAFGVPWILMFSWNSATCSGYTKRLTRNAIVMFFYCVANLISPQLWQDKDGPRYYPAWIVQIVLSFSIAPLIALVIWYILRKRNIERVKALSEEEKKFGLIEVNGEKLKANIAMLDLTDLENKTFIYPL